MSPRRYDSPARRAQVAETRDRILDAASALVHEFQSWDWRPLTCRAVAERAGVGERTVYRHFATVQALHEAVMQRLGRESGVVYEGMTVDDIAPTGAKVFASLSTFAAPGWVEPDDPALVAEDERRRKALLEAVGDTRAAAALDVLWGVPSFQRLTTGWGLDADEATEVVRWVVDLVVDATRTERGGSV